ncbi:DNA methyltransferase [Corynebacterium variabile]|uniref:DNA methyltransferase n=1 Tax=Corynebacterium variabile TaxID=1727 RepID=UPI00289BE59F|nr:DNA methyltransferase [Corynebacterium variabile]
MITASPTRLDRGTIRRHLDKFSAHWRERIDGWRETGAKHTEKSYAQQFWSDLLKSFGVITERIDLFEKDARRATTGNTGYIDLFWSGVVIGEAKSLGHDLNKATEQARDYLAGGSIAQHEWPRYSIVSDFENLRVTKLGDDGWTVSFTIDEITAHIDQLIFLAGQETVTKAEEEEASIHASRLMANLYTAMVGDEADEAIGDDAPTDPEEEDWQVQKTSVFLTRVLFLLYGDDAGLWEEDLFYRFVLWDTNPDNLGGQLAQLFQVLNTPEHRRRNVPDSMAKFPYVNGGLFADSWPSEFFTEEMRDALLAACRFHWTRISPAVFGSMFQLVKSKEARRVDGEHYTTETNILKVIEPLFLDELRGEADRLIRNKSTSAKDLRKFLDSLAALVFLDPACGCGNFLVVAYRELRSIETDVIVALRAKEGQLTASMDVSLDQRMNIGQFHGFELNWWPAKIAETAMFLVDHQANRALAAAVGDAPERLPITITAHIRHGNALQLGWEYEIPRTPGETFVFGNPPFRGDARTREQQAELQEAWGKKKQISRMDYVTGWHAKTLDLLTDREGAFAYVTTNSITQGDQVPRLFGPIFDAGWRIRFAHRTFAWNSDAPGKAAVHCVIVGFDRQKSPRPVLWDYPDINGSPAVVAVEYAINGYLVDGPNVLVEKASKPISAEVATAVNGCKPADGGNFNVPADELEEVLADAAAAKYLRRFVGARELLHHQERWCLWLRDVSPEDVTKSSILRQHLEGVRAFRAASKNPPTNKLQHEPQRFFFDGSRDTPYVSIPRHVSSSRRFFTVERFGAEVISGDANFTLADPSGLQLGLISSSMFITWQKAVGGRIKSDLRFSNTLTWHTFPVPEFDEKTRVAIIKAGQSVIDARALHPERSLADAYNPLAMDPALVKAHAKLDREVDKAFGADRKLNTERQRLEILFARYAEMTADV